MKSKRWHLINNRQYFQDWYYQGVWRWRHRHIEE